MDLWISLLFSMIGAGYFLYGKKESEIWFMIIGGLLCFYPYVVSSLVPMVLVGVVLMTAPFAAERMGWRG